MVMLRLLVRKRSECGEMTWCKTKTVALFALIVASFASLGNAQTSTPRIVGMAQTNSGAFALTVQGKAGRRLRLETTKSLIETNWQSRGITTASKHNLDLSDTPSGTDTALFYRVVMMPGTNPPAWGSAAETLTTLVENNTNVVLTWEPPSDLLDITNYYVYMGTSLVATVAGTGRAYRVSGLSTGVSYTFSVQALDEDGNWSTGQITKTVTPSPADPAAVAPEPDKGVASLVSANAEFLFSGTNAIQTGVEADALEPARMAALRGHVYSSSNTALQGVLVTVEDNPEYGQTVSRDDGAYNLAVNGGQSLKVNYSKYGCLPVQRAVDAPWQDYATLDDVIMIAADTNRTAVSLSASTQMLTASSSTVSDDRGQRKAMVMFPTGVAASIITAEGETQQVASLTTMFTEYTVGTNGPSAMPGDLPPTVAYTYCIELGSAEAEKKVDGKDVLFNTNVYFYVDNFIGMPAGIPVPVGYYDKDMGSWVPASDGLVINLKGTNAGGLAEIDTDGDDAPDAETNLTALGFTDAERLKLAMEYSPTASLWRVPIKHFSTYDLNYPQTTENSEYPNNGQPRTSGRTDDPTGKGGGGEVEMENQIYRETIPVVGTPFELCYSSDRVPGNLAGRSIDIPLSGSSLPAYLQRILLQVSVAGRFFETNYAPVANLTYRFEWDGLDIYGRQAMGNQVAKIRIGYRYNAFYAIPWYSRLYGGGSFGLPGSAPVSGYIPVPGGANFWQEYESLLAMGAPTNGLGGWTLSAHHNYDPVGKTLLLGDGARRSLDDSASIVITTVAGKGTAGLGGDGGQATNAYINSPRSVAVGADGSLYISDTANSRIRKVSTNGIIRTIATTGTPQQIAVEPDGSVYVVDEFYSRIRRVWPSGIITTIAGTGTQGHTGDGGQATNAQINTQGGGIAVASDGTVYFTEYFGHAVRRIGPDGIITTIAGKYGTYGHSGDGGYGTNALVYRPKHMALAQDGTLYWTEEWGGHRIRKLRTDGIIETAAGSKNGTPGLTGDGGPATNALFNQPAGIAAWSDGSLYIADLANHRVRKITSDGIVFTLAGIGSGTALGDNGPAAAAGLADPEGVAVGKDGSVYVADKYHHRIRKIAKALPGFSNGMIEIASEDGQEVYQFEADGRHVKTLHALTGATLYQFTYSNGWLIAVADANGNTTTVQRTASGTPTAIRSPYNQQTTLMLNSNGYLAFVANQASETTILGYGSGGLLTSIRGARGGAYTYTATYTSTGHVSRMADPAGGSTTFARTALSSNNWEVLSTTELGRTSTARIETLSNGDKRRTYVLPDSTAVQTLETPAGVETNTFPDGTVVTQMKGPDPRFGMQAPVVTGLIVRLPSGLTSTVTQERVAGILGDTWTGLRSLTNRITVNGRAYVTVFSASNRQWTVTTPAGRQITMLLDSLGRATNTAIGGLAPLSFAYESRGRLSQITQADRSVSLQYSAEGPIESVVDSLFRTNRFLCDAAGRPTNAILPDGRVLALGYDAHGNQTSITPPGRPAHSLEFNLLDKLSAYTPPVVGGETNRVSFSYNADRKPLRVVLPDGAAASNSYDSAGRLSQIVTPDGSYQLAYSTSGLLTSVSSPDNVALGFRYDGFLLTNAQWTGVITGNLAWTLNSDLMFSTMTVNGSNAVTFRYDADNFLTNAGQSVLIRDPTNGRLTGSSQGNFSAVYARNEFGEITNAVSSWGGTNLFQESVAFDGMGRITSRMEAVESVTNVFVYTYDQNGRLTQATTNGVVASSYGYDDNGNCTNAVTWEGARTSVYDDQDRMIRLVSNGTFTNEIGWSPSGWMTNVTMASQNTRLSFDVGGRLRQVALMAGTTNEHIYDGLGRLVGKKINGFLVKGWLWRDGLRPVAELDYQTNVVSVFVYGSKFNIPDYMVKTGVVYRIVSDRLGSPRLVVNVQDGVVAQRMEFDAYGRKMRDTNQGFQPFGFAGGLYDPYGSVVKFGARWYDPAMGRWSSRDPLLFGGAQMNLYAYVNGDPVNYVDFTGCGPGKGGQEEEGGGGVWDFVKKVASQYDPTAMARDAVKLANEAQDIRQERQNMVDDPFGTMEEQQRNGTYTGTLDPAVGKGTVAVGGFVTAYAPNIVLNPCPIPNPIPSADSIPGAAIGVMGSYEQDKIDADRRRRQAGNRSQ